jgi:hypothetical protein
MSWTDLLEEPRLVTGIYGAAPSLKGFALEDLLLAGGQATIQGDLELLPDPMPKRWIERGYSCARAKLQAIDLEASEVSGAPRLRLDAGLCLQGVPVDITVEKTTKTWNDESGGVHPYVAVTGASEFLIFSFVCKILQIEVRGYEPSPY